MQSSGSRDRWWMYNTDGSENFTSANFFNVHDDDKIITVVNCKILEISKHPTMQRLDVGNPYNNTGKYP